MDSNETVGLPNAHVHGTDVPVHRGALAGTGPAERKAAIAAETERVLQESEATGQPSGLSSMALEEPPLYSFAEELAQKTRDELLDDARELGLKGYSKLTKAQLAEVLVAHDIEERTDVWLDAAWVCPAAEYRTLRTVLAAGGCVTFPAAEASEHNDIAVFPPLTSAFLWNGVYTVVVPRELTDVYVNVDWDALEQRRDQLERCIHGVTALASLRGLVQVDDACQVCNVWYGMDLSPKDFLISLAMAADSRDLEFSISEINDELYFKDLMLAYEEEGLETEEDEQAFENYLNHLLKRHAEVQPRPLPDELRTMDPINWKFELPAVQALMSYLDEQVPEGENDYFYAERMVEGFLVDVLASSNVRDQVEFLIESGVPASVASSPTMRSLLTVMNDELPRWENNGWSDRELREQATGRKVFRRDDGSEQKVGRNDPCPCGSGKKYKKCCGK